jgi:3-phosphoglycerate kinase
VGILEPHHRLDRDGREDFENSGGRINMSTAVSSSVSRKKSLTTLPVAGKRVLVRVDFNVPLDKEGKVTDDARLRAHIPTIEYLIEKKAKIILIAHLGRPKGAVNAKYSLKPVVKPLGDLLKQPVLFADDCIGPKAYEAVAKLKAGEVLLLENLRFHNEEESNNAVFAKEMASYADVFVQDAFGAVHRAHASTAQLPALLPSAAGVLLEKELKFLGGLKANPAHPYVALLGGAKVSDKLAVVETFVDQADALFVGGAMAYTFLKAQGIEVGDSRIEPDFVAMCSDLLAKAKEKNVQIVLPQDHVIVQDIEKPEAAKVTEGVAIPAGWKGVDIGPNTLASIVPLVNSAKTIFWNGPAGIFEMPAYANGTMGLAKAVAEAAKAGATAVVGGGDSVAAVNKAGVASQITYISTGGGASMEFLEGQELPGVKALPEA